MFNRAIYSNFFCCTRERSGVTYMKRVLVLLNENNVQKRDHICICSLIQITEIVKKIFLKN